MKRTITTLAFVLGATAVAAASDLPSKTAPAAPIFTQSTYYAGVNLGANNDKNRVYTGGIVAGVNVLPYLAVEAAYDFGYPKDKTGAKREYTNEVAGNVLPQYKVTGTDFTVYGLGGIGYKWDSIAVNHAFYNVGGGLMYDLSKTIELDGRYRYSEAIDSKKFKGDDQRLTFGVNYKF